MAAADGAPGFPELVTDLAARFGNIYKQSVPVLMDDDNADWDILYPFSQVRGLDWDRTTRKTAILTCTCTCTCDPQFLTPYKIPLPQPYGYVSPWPSKFKVTTALDAFNMDRFTRSLILIIDHPGVIWTVRRNRTRGC